MSIEKDFLVYFRKDDGFRSLRHRLTYNKFCRQLKSDKQTMTPEDYVRFSTIMHRNTLEATVLTAMIFNQAVQVLPVGSLVIDAGCGNGLHLSFMAQQHRHLRFVGYDFASNAEEIVTKRLKRDGLANAVRFHAVSHAQAHGKISNADLLFCNAPFIIEIPHPDSLPANNSSEWEELMKCETMIELRDQYQSFRQVLKTGGTATIVQGICCQMTMDMHTQIANSVGLKLMSMEKYEVENVEDCYTTVFFAM